MQSEKDADVDIGKWWTRNSLRRVQLAEELIC